MPRGRTLISLEFVGPECARVILDEAGWRLLHQRQMGEATLQRARALLARIQAAIPAPREDGLPHTLMDLGQCAATTCGLRNTQRKFRNHG